MKKANRDYLTPSEIDSLLKATATSRYRTRYTLILHLLYRHGLRATELCNLELTDVDMKAMRLHVRRLKNGFDAVHPLQPDTMRLIKLYLKEREDHVNRDCDYLLLSERGPMTRFTLTYILASLGKAAKIPFKVHPHMLRHSTGYYLANKGTDTRLIQDYLGHRNISNTVRYTAVNAARFKDLWK